MLKMYTFNKKNNPYAGLANRHQVHVAQVSCLPDWLVLRIMSVMVSTSADDHHAMQHCSKQPWSGRCCSPVRCCSTQNNDNHIYIWVMMCDWVQHVNVREQVFAFEAASRHGDTHLQHTFCLDVSPNLSHAVCVSEVISAVCFWVGRWLVMKNLGWDVSSGSAHLVKRASWPQRL